jgi:hypothetical protein
MGWVLMSERDVRRIEVLTEVFRGNALQLRLQMCLQSPHDRFDGCWTD